MRNLLLAGGIAHPFDETAPALAALFAKDGIASDIHEDVEPALKALNDEHYDLLTVHCLRWTMTQHEKYAPNRARWAISLSEQGRAAIREHVERGGGLLGVHGASISFDDWPEWCGILGAAWRWGRSHHPPYGSVVAHIVDGDHPITRAIQDFRVEDELYSELEVDPAAIPLAEAWMAQDGKPAPILLAKDGPGGRRVYSALGHDAASIAEPSHAEILRRAARWALRLPSR